MSKIWIFDFKDIRPAGAKEGFLPGVEDTLDLLKARGDTLTLAVEGDRTKVWGEIGFLELLNRWFKSVDIVSEMPQDVDTFPKEVAV